MFWPDTPAKNSNASHANRRLWSRLPNLPGPSPDAPAKLREGKARIEALLAQLADVDKALEKTPQGQRRANQQRAARQAADRRLAAITKTTNEILAVTLPPM